MPIMKRSGTIALLLILSLLTCGSLAVFCSCSVRTIIPYEEREWNTDSIQVVLKKPNLKVLDIGNSYTDGAVALLPMVVEYSGADVDDMCLFKITRGGSSFKTWCNIYNNNDNSTYVLNRVVGDLSVDLPWWDSATGDSRLFKQVLTDVEWDIIIIHQVSNYAPYYDQWTGDGDGGYFKELLRIIRKHQPKAHIGFLLVHSYWDYFNQNQEKSSLVRWQKIADSVKQLQKDYPVQFVIPYGTAVENLRASSLNNSYDLTSDGTHCGYGLCQYAAACCYYESLIAPRTGVSCYNSPAYLDVSDKESTYPGVNVIPSNALLAQKAALLAIQDMFHCYNPEKY